MGCIDENGMRRLASMLAEHGFEVEDEGELEELASALGRSRNLRDTLDAMATHGFELESEEEAHSFVMGLPPRLRHRNS